MIRHAMILKFRAVVIPWDPAAHDGEDESTESLRERLKEAWPRLLRENNVQAVGGTVHERYDDGITSPHRRLYAWSWSVGTEVPLTPEQAAAIDPARLHGVISWDDETNPYEWELQP